MVLSVDHIDEARKKEARKQLLLLPVAVLLLLVVAGVYVVMLSEELTFNDVTYYGYAKAIWFFNLTLTGGLALVVTVSSFTVLILIGLLARNLGAQMHPWRPIAISTSLLVVAFALLYMARWLNQLISANVDNIDRWFIRQFGEQSVIATIFDLLAIMASAFILAIIFGLLAQVVSLPFHAKSIAEKIRTINKAKQAGTH